jgi:hypothetical protein
MLKHYKKNQIRVPARVDLLAPFWLAAQGKVYKRGRIG